MKINHTKDLTDPILIALRRISRAIDLHSRKLVQSHGLTGPQALLLKQLVARPAMTVGELAQALSLSQGTITDIVIRLEKRGLLQRARADGDRRRVLVSLTQAGRTLLAESPPLLQERFTERLRQLQDWEQTQLLASLQRIAAMMDASELDAAPLLASGPPAAPAEAVQALLAHQVADDSPARG